ncbi:hypothetical protein IGI04_039751, partial [Brassica rapa subsp. trilocularis]
ETSNFRKLNRISTRNNQIVIITSIILRLHEGKLSLTTTHGTRFYFDNELISYNASKRGINCYSKPHSKRYQSTFLKFTLQFSTSIN